MELPPPFNKGIRAQIVYRNDTWRFFSKPFPIWEPIETWKKKAIFFFENKV